MPQSPQRSSTSLWTSQASKTNAPVLESVEDFYRQQKINQRRERMEKVMEEDRQKKALLETNGCVTKVLD